MYKLFFKIVFKFFKCVPKFQGLMSKNIAIYILFVNFLFFGTYKRHISMLRLIALRWVWIPKNMSGIKTESPSGKIYTTFGKQTRIVPKMWKLITSRCIRDTLVVRAIHSLPYVTLYLYRDFTVIREYLNVIKHSIYLILL